MASNLKELVDGSKEILNMFRVERYIYNTACVISILFIIGLIIYGISINEFNVGQGIAFFGSSGIVAGASISIYKLLDKVFGFIEKNYDKGQTNE